MGRRQGEVAERNLKNPGEPSRAGSDAVCPTGESIRPLRGVDPLSVFVRSSSTSTEPDRPGLPARVAGRWFQVSGTGAPGSEPRIGARPRFFDFSAI